MPDTAMAAAPVLDPVLTGGDPFWERVPKKGDFPSQVRANQ